MDPKVRRSWEEFLNPDVARPRLIAVSIYIAAFEAMKNSVVGRIRDFLWSGFDESSDKIDPKYQSDLLSRNRSPVHASLDWLKEMNAIDDGDLAAFDRFKACRNTLAHELLSTVSSEGLPLDFEQCLSEMVGLHRKIELWWITNGGIPTNPDFDRRDVDEEEIVPGPVMAIQLLLEIGLGDEEQSRFYYNKFRKHSEGG